MSGVLLPVVGVLSGAGALVLLAIALVKPSERVSVHRLDPNLPPPPGAVTGLTQQALGVIDRQLARRGTATGISRTLQGAGLRLSPADFLLLTSASMVLAAAIGLLLGGPAIGLLLGTVTALVAKIGLGVLAGRRRAKFSDQLDDSLQLMASSLRAGHSVLRAMDSVAQEAPAPTSEEFARLINETRVGRDLSQSLDEMAVRMGSKDFAWTAQAIAIQREVGGNLAEVLDAVGHTIRERNAIRRQVKALSAEGKLSAIILMGLPFAIAAFLSVANPEYIGQLTQSLLGYCMLAAAAVLMTLGGLWLRATVRITF